MRHELDCLNNVTSENIFVSIPPQNVFIHFEPLGHALRHEEECERDRDEESDLADLYERARKKLRTKCSDDGECKARVDLNVDHRVPHYIVPGSEEEWRWVQTHPKARLVSVLFGCALF